MQVFICKTYKIFFETFLIITLSTYLQVRECLQTQMHPDHDWNFASSLAKVYQQHPQLGTARGAAHFASPCTFLPPGIGKTLPELEAHFRSIYVTV